MTCLTNTDIENFRPRSAFADCTDLPGLLFLSRCFMPPFFRAWIIYIVISILKTYPTVVTANMSM